MSKGKLFIFDLDGTLIDSLEDLKQSVNYAFRTMGIEEKSTEDVRKAIGNGALRLIEELLPDHSSHRKDEAFNHFITHYNEHCSEQTIIYEGVREFLTHLSENPLIRIALLTNKPEEATRIILKRLELDKFFGLVIGGDTLPLRKPDPAGILHAMEFFAISKSETVMIGDSLPDIKAARAAGVRSVGIQSGFGDGSATPDVAVSKFSEIQKLRLESE